MTTNQTIDGVPRELLERCARELSIGIGPAPKNRAQELRALLDAPAVEPEIPEYFVEACDKFDWTPEEALRFYADGKHFDTANGRTRILCTGAIASHALKGMGEGYAAMKGIEPATQPQGEPVAHTMKTVMQAYENAQSLHLQGTSNFCAVMAKHLNKYAEQPAPVAVVLPERFHQVMQYLMGAGDLDGYYFKDSHPSGRKYWWRNELRACLDEVTRLNSARPTHANPPPGTEPSGTHRDNDGLDDYRVMGLKVVEDASVPPGQVHVCKP